MPPPKNEWRQKINDWQTPTFFNAKKVRTSQEKDHHCSWKMGKWYEQSSKKGNTKALKTWRQVQL